MSTILDAYRKRWLVPASSEVTFEARGFHRRDPQVQQHLETSALQFLVGFEFAVEQAHERETILRLGMLERQYQGFAYEGAAMALALRDALRPSRGSRATEFMSGAAADHIFMAYLGIGFALARLPRPLWRRALPDQSRMPDHPTLSWLVMDGYGFHQAFFRTAQWVGRQYRPAGIRFNGRTDYVPRAIDQGVGRAMWFVCGGDVARLTDMLNAFPQPRRADLWSGAGLAATYAGGVEAEDLRLFAKNAGRYRPEVALGGVLALKARVLSGLVSEHNEVASEIFCELPAERAAAFADQAVLDLHEEPQRPAYEIFRRRIQANFE